MTIGSVPELISSISALIVAVFVVHILIKLGRLIDNYREEVKEEKTINVANKRGGKKDG